MKRLAIILLSGVCCLGQQASAAGPAKVAFDTYSGYFVSNKFEPKAAESFVVIHDQEQFDKVFGVAFVMRDKSHRLSKDAFKSLMVVAAIKRGNAFVEFKVDTVTEAGGVVELRYTTTEKKGDTATFACPLIVSIPKGEYKAIQFVEGGKPVKKISLIAQTVEKGDNTQDVQKPEKDHIPAKSLSHASRQLLIDGWTQERVQELYGRPKESKRSQFMSPK